jgi:hypothetical protein
MPIPKTHPANHPIKPNFDSKAIPKKCPPEIMNTRINNSIIFMTTSFAGLIIDSLKTSKHQQISPRG